MGAHRGQGQHILCWTKGLSTGNATSCLSLEQTPPSEWERSEEGSTFRMEFGLLLLRPNCHRRKVADEAGNPKIYVSLPSPIVLLSAPGPWDVLTGSYQRL